MRMRNVKIKKMVTIQTKPLEYIDQPSLKGGFPPIFHSPPPQAHYYYRPSLDLPSICSLLPFSHLFALRE